MLKYLNSSTNRGGKVKAENLGGRSCVHLIMEESGVYNVKIPLQMHVSLHLYNNPQKAIIACNLTSGVGLK